MSRYMLNKFLTEVESHDENLTAFKQDPEGFVAFWESQAEAPRPPFPAGGTLTAAERAACVALDYAALYAMGAHPYLLWHFVRAVLVSEEFSVGDLSDTFKRAVAPLERPDFTT